LHSVSPVTSNLLEPARLMTLSSRFQLCLAFGYLLHYALISAYEIQINGQRIQVDVVDENGAFYKDRAGMTDDFGNSFRPQKGAICSSLRGDPCVSVTTNHEDTHNLFNYFPHHSAESVVAHANARFHGHHIDAHSLKQPLDDRTLGHLSRQNPHVLGTKPTQIKRQQTMHGTAPSAQTMMQSVASLLSGSTEPLKHVGTRTIKYNTKKKRTPNTPPSPESTSDGEGAERDSSHSTSSSDDGTAREHSMEETEVEIEFYSANGQDGDLAAVLGFDENEAAEAVDSIVRQLVTSYLESDKGDEVDGEAVDLYSQLFGGEGAGEEEREFVLDLNEEEITELLSQIASSRKSDNEDGAKEDSHIFALKFIVEGDEGTEPDEDDPVMEDANERLHDEDSQQLQ